MMIIIFFILSIGQPPRATLTYTLLPFTTLCRSVHRLARRLLRDAATHMNGRWARGESQRSGVNPLIVQRPDDTNKAKGAVIHAAVMDETDRTSTRLNSSH